MQTKNTTTTNTKTLLTIKIDKKLKLAAQKTAEYIGIPLGTFVNSTLKDFVRTKQVRLGGESYMPNAETIRAIKQGEKDFKAGKLGKSMTLDELALDWGLK